jgi:uncharacterized protein (TIGR02466 family)
MEIKPIFTTVIAIDQLQLDNVALENYCRQKVGEFENQQHEKTSQSTFIDQHDPELQPLLNLIKDRVNQLHIELGFTDQAYQKVTNIWANINNSEPIDELHSHPGVFFNAIYYVSAPPGSSSLMMLTPNPMLDHIVHSKTVQHWNAFNSSWQEIKPETGMLVIMPAWIKHYVRKHTMEADRISIVFDSVMLPK